MSIRYKVADYVMKNVREFATIPAISEGSGFGNEQVGPIMSGLCNAGVVEQQYDHRTSARLYKAVGKWTAQDCVAAMREYERKRKAVKRRSNGAAAPDTAAPPVPATDSTQRDVLVCIPLSGNRTETLSTHEARLVYDALHALFGGSS